MRRPFWRVGCVVGFGVRELALSCVFVDLGWIARLFVTRVNYSSFFK